MCISFPYTLNFRCHKICLEQLPGFMKSRVKTLNEYLERINCDPFFYWDQKCNGIDINFNNPKMSKLIAKTDHRPVLYRS